MVRNGYPTPPGPHLCLLPDLIAQIKANNTPQGWAADPNGLTACLQDASNPPGSGVNWQELASQNGPSVLLSMLYWMDQQQFAVPTLIDGDHWVVVIGWQTDKKPPLPNTTPAPVLQSLTYHDPLYETNGARIQVAASQWAQFTGASAASALWAPVYSDGTWQSDYVAIIQEGTPDAGPVRPLPPKLVVERALRARRRPSQPQLAERTVNGSPVRRTGRMPLRPTQAIAAAIRAIDEQRLRETPTFRLLARGDVEYHRPLLTREEAPVRDSDDRVRERSRRARVARADQIPHYYIVPFGLRGERGRTGQPLARVCLQVNAYTGAFEEATAFGAPVEYLTKEEVRSIVARALRTGPKGLKHFEATLVFQPCAITHVRAYPFWRAQFDGRTLYVEQSGRIHSSLPRSIPGE
jgi:hypothetical protein